MSDGAVFVDVLPSFAGFQRALTDGVLDAARTAGRAAGDTFGDMFSRSATRAAGSDRAAFGRAGREAGKAFADASGGEIEGGAGKASGGFKAALGKTMGAAAGLAAGVAAAAGFAQAFSDALDLNKAQAKLEAQLGAYGSYGQQIGKSAGNLFKDAYGDSISDVNDAIKSVLQNGVVMEDATSGELESITGQVMSLAQAFDQDLGGATRAVGQLLRTGLVKDSQEALDVITRGFQQGADKGEDLLDTLNEYPTQFRKLGLDAKTATGLLTQGLQAGARDSDIVADALKEFAIRAVDGSKTTAQGFKAIGLSADDMAAKIGKGGKSASGALDVTLDRIRAIKDPVLQSQAAVALFGTQAEDLGAALYKLDPSKAVAALGQVDGAAKKVDQTLGQTAGATLEKFKRSITQNVTEGMGAFIQAFQSGTVTQDGWLGKVQDVALATRGFTSFITGTAVPALTSLADYVRGNIGPELQTFRGLVSDLHSWWANKLVPALQSAVASVMPTVRQAVADVTQAFRDNREMIDKARAILSVLGLLLTEAVIPAVAFLARILIENLVAQFRVTATIVNEVVLPALKGIISVFLSVVDTLVQGAADAFGWIPGIGPKLREAADKFGEFRDQVNRALNGIEDQTVTVGTTVYFKDGTVRFKGSAAVARADGGFIRGPGGPRDDQIPAWLSNGEYVVNAAQTARYRPLLEAINSGRTLPGFANGGLVVSPKFSGLAETDAAVLRAVQAEIARLAPKLAEAMTSSLGAASGPVSTAGARALGKQMAAAYGWTGGQWAALERLWTGESGWNPRAKNPTSTAFGIPQFLKSTAKAYGLAYGDTDAGHQIAAGLRYIKNAYGSPGNAYAKWSSRHPHWYDQGGILPTGLSLVANGTGQPEAILNPDQWRTVAQLADGGGRRVDITINYPPDLPTEQAIVNAQATADLLANF